MPRCVRISWSPMPPIHDRLFKGLLRTFLPDLLRLTVPEVAGKLDLSRLSFLDKELLDPSGAREADLLVRLPLRDRGGSLLVHIEIEARSRKTLPERIREYQSRIQLRYGTRVLTLVVILRGGQPGVRIEPPESGLPVADFRYVVFGLAGCSAPEYLARPEALAWALAALMDPGTWSPAELRRECLRRIAGAKLKQDHRMALVNCVGTYLQLVPGDAEEPSPPRQQEGPGMQLMWSERMERRGFRKGVSAGRKEGQRLALQRIILRVLEQRFGPVPDTLRQQVEEIDSLQRLTRLFNRALAAASLRELRLR
jgi:hypothetical protein